MKLDRNINSDGSGKYALLKLRRLRELYNQPDWSRELSDIGDALALLKTWGLIHYGNESPGDQFFVMKYKDRFTHDGLKAYANAVREEAVRLQRIEPEVSKSLFEYADEITVEAFKATNMEMRIPD